MEAAASGKIGDRPDDGAAGSLDRRQHLFEIPGVDDNQRATRSNGAEIGEAALQPAIVEFAVIGAVIGETPAEGRAVKGFGGGDVGNVEFDIIDAAIVVSDFSDIYLSIRAFSMARSFSTWAASAENCASVMPGRRNSVNMTSQPSPFGTMRSAL